MTQLVLPPPHRNHQLFSDYYLDHTLGQRADWQSLAAHAAPVMAQLQGLYAAYTPSNNEAQLEAELIRPILTALGHTFEVQAALKTPDGTKKPDYVLYRDAAALQANKNKTLTDVLLQPGAIAVADAKAWDRSLDMALREGKADVFTNKNPSFQIAFYMQHSGLAWGILTNGRVWRLYHRDTAHKLDRFYEVDLVTLLNNNDPARFLFFYAFFRRAAFDAGPLSLDAILQASRDYARGVGDSLKTQVYDALLHLAQGFLDHPANQLRPDAATLHTIYDHSLIVLYRLLFILYAEARDLLPIRASTLYRDQYSLMAIKRRVAGDLDKGTHFLSTSALYWEQLRELFRSIDQGNPPLQVATFNGGLFDGQRYPFLETMRVGDARLQHAIDLLARVNGEFVDYRDLAERHLGTIYEGLLEYHLEPKDDGISPSAFTIQLLNDRGERKATGSYYTPDYIVKYIVDHTVRPVLDAAVAGLRDDAAISSAVLAVNVLDPAMGSGHFLVEATECIARYLVDLGVRPAEPTDGEADITYWKRRVVQSCIYGVDLNPLAVDLAKLSLWLSTVAHDRPLSFLDHHLRAGNALVGARIADLQVGAHGAGAQRKGKSRKAAAANAAQLSLLDDDAFRQSMSTAVDSMWLIERSPGASVADVKAQEHAYEQLRDALTRRYGRLADLVTATYFGVQVDASMWQALADYVTGRRPFALPRFAEWAQQAEQIAAERRFFHWELEFPEIFFDRHGQPLNNGAGFDAVIGNPPYIRESGNKALFEYVQKAEPFRTHYQGKTDIYFYFLMKGVWLLKSEKALGFIVPGNWLEAVSSTNLRAFLATEAKARKIVAFGGLQVFEEAAVEPIILIVEKAAKDHHLTFVFRNSSQKFAQEVLKQEHFVEVPESAIQIDGWYLRGLQNSALSTVFEKVDQGGKFIGELFHVEAGINSGADFVSTRSRAYWPAGVVEGEGIFVVSRAEINKLNLSSVEIQYVKKYIPAEYVGRYFQFDDDDHFLIYLQRDDNISSLPSIEAHLKKYKSILENRAEIVRNPSRKWWHLLWPRSSEVYDAPHKIVIANATARNSFYLDSSQCYYNIGCTVLVPQQALEFNVFYVLAVLNSRLLDLYYGVKGQMQADVQRKYFPDKVRKIPIRRIAFTTPPDERARLADKGRRLYEQFCQKADYACVLGFVDHHLPDEQSPIQNPQSKIDAAPDTVHDLLAFLAEQMIALHEQRHAAVEDFILNLEGVLDAAAVAKLGRLWTPPAAEPPAEAAAVLGALATRRLSLRDDIGALNEAQWRWLLKHRLKRIDDLAALVKLFRTQQPPIAALDARIAATDRLIDRIVYRLYGLTDAEIALVEGGNEQ